MSDWLGVVGKVVVAIGGSSRIGRSTVENLLKQNVQAVNLDVTKCHI